MTEPSTDKARAPLGNESSGATRNHELTRRADNSEDGRSAQVHSPKPVAIEQPQWFALGNEIELEQINSAVAALKSADVVVVRDAFATLQEFERRGQFRMQPSETDV